MCDLVRHEDVTEREFCGDVGIEAVAITVGHVLPHVGRRNSEAPHEITGKAVVSTTTQAIIRSPRYSATHHTADATMAASNASAFMADRPSVRDGPGTCLPPAAHIDRS